MLTLVFFFSRNSTHKQTNRHSQKGKLLCSETIFKWSCTGHPTFFIVFVSLSSSSVLSSFFVLAGRKCVGDTTTFITISVGVFFFSVSSRFSICLMVILACEVEKSRTTCRKKCCFFFNKKKSFAKKKNKRTKTLKSTGCGLAVSKQTLIQKYSNCWAFPF